MSKPEISSPVSSLIESVNGPDRAAHAPALQPRLGGLEQRCEHLGIVLALEKAEMPGRIAVALEMEPIDLGADPSDRAVAAQRQPVRDLGMLEVGVLLGVQMLQALEQERLHPVRVARVQPRRHLQKLLQRAPVLDRLDAQGCHQDPPRAVTRT